jgi:rhodanese-related sulfurtransferase
MEYCSVIIKDLAYFGPSPSQEIANKLLLEGIDVFVDLTTTEDRTESYMVPNKINYPIKDNNIPENIPSFTFFIRQLELLLARDKKIYIHCRAGHGRSGMVAACLLSEFKKYSPVYSIKLITDFHRERKIMKDKWRNKMCPNSHLQRKFVKEQFGYSDAYYIVNILKRTMITLNNTEIPLETYTMCNPNINILDTILMVANNNDIVKNCFLYSRRPFYSKNCTLFKLTVEETGELLNTVKKKLL